MIVSPPTIAEIIAASERLHGAIERTPCLESRTLSRICGSTLFLKFDNLQFTASFKERGALNKLLALDADQPCRDGMTIAEGIAVKSAGTLTREIVRALVDDILLVDESAIERAVALLLSVEKTVVEGAAAVGLAAILEHPALFSGLRVATPLTGGNIDLRVLASVAMRELVRGGRLLRIRVAISDAQGVLARLAGVAGEAGANIVDIAHDRLPLSLNPKGASIDMVVEVQDGEHGQTVLAALQNAGFDAALSAV